MGQHNNVLQHFNKALHKFSKVQYLPTWGLNLNSAIVQSEILLLLITIYFSTFRIKLQRIFSLEAHSDSLKLLWHEQQLVSFGFWII